MPAFTDDQYRRAHFNEAPVGIAYVAPDGKIIKANERFAELLGFSQAELESKRFQDFTHPEDIPGGLGILQRIMAGEQDDGSFNKRYLSKTGDIIWCHLHTRAYRGQNNNVEFFISHIIPMPNGGKFKVEKKGEDVVIRPTITVPQFVKDNPKWAAVAIFLVCYLLFKDTELMQSLLELFKILK